MGFRSAYTMGDGCRQTRGTFCHLGSVYRVAHDSEGSTNNASVGEGKRMGGLRARARILDGTNQISVVADSNYNRPLVPISAGSAPQLIGLHGLSADRKREPP